MQRRNKALVDEIAAIDSAAGIFAEKRLSDPMG